MSGSECWSYGPESDWCGEHDSPLNVVDPKNPDLWICHHVAGEWEMIEGWADGDPFTYVNTRTGEVVDDLAFAQRLDPTSDGGARPTEATDW